MVSASLVVLTMLLWGLAAAPLAHAQTLSFEKTWGGTNEDNGRSVAIDSSSGNVYVTGETYSFGNYSDVVLLKYDSSGTLKWQRTWGGTNYDIGLGVAVDGSGNIYVTGYTYSFGTGGDVVLLKFAPSGVLLWQETWGGTSGDYGYGVAVDASGNIYVAGSEQSYTVGGFEVVLLKFDPSGGLVWQRTWGGTGDDEGHGVAVDGSGHIYVTGMTTSYGAGKYDVVLLQFDSSGGLNWQEIWGGTGTDQGLGVAVDGSSNIYVTGYTNSTGAGNDDVFLLKCNPGTGSVAWQRTWGGLGSEWGLGVAVDGSGSIYVNGWTGSYGGGSADVVLLKYDSSGGLGWQKTWGGGSDDYPDGGSGIAAHAGWVAFTGNTGESVRTLNDVSGFIGIPSGTEISLANTARTPTFTLGTPSGTVGTPSGSETYADDVDIFLLGFSTGHTVQAVQGFTAFPTNNVLMVIGDLAINPHGSKPSGVNYQQGRDTTPLGYLSGMVNNTQPSMFDTNVAIDATSGRPLSSIPQTLIFTIGGPGINAVTHYYENTDVAADRAPVKFGYDSTDFFWMFTSNGVKVPGSEVLQSSTAVPPGTSDVFVIQTLRDADGRLVVLMYGTRYTGTWAAAWWFKFVAYPNIQNYTNSYYIVRWTDATSGTSANFMPDSGDTFTILAQGTP